MSEKRYQVFVSSTYSDLKAERTAVLHELLDMGCIPTGMNLYFSATEKEKWNHIKKTIDDCDYYLVIVGGRYGSLAPSGVSYTHMELTYAITKRKPIIAYVNTHPEFLPAEHREPSREGQLKLKDFRQQLQKHKVIPWTDATSLAVAVRKSFPLFMKDHPAIGWVRANNLTDMKMARENAELKRQLADLQAERERHVREPRRSIDDVANEPVSLHYSCKVYVKGDCKQATCSVAMTWYDIFAALAPSMLDDVTESFMEGELADRVAEVALAEAQKLYPKAHAVRDIEITKSSFNSIKVQLRAMGLIQKLNRSENGKNYWRLTPLGDTKMSTLIGRQPAG